MSAKAIKSGQITTQSRTEHSPVAAGLSSQQPGVKMAVNSFRISQDRGNLVSCQIWEKENKRGQAQTKMKKEETWSEKLSEKTIESLRKKENLKRNGKKSRQFFSTFRLLSFFLLSSLYLSFFLFFSFPFFLSFFLSGTLQLS